MIDIENMNSDELIKWYGTETTEQDSEQVYIQKIFIKNGLIEFLLGSSLLIKDSKVIQKILENDICKKERIIISGKIENINLIFKNSTHIKVNFEITEKQTKKKYNLVRDYGYSSIEPVKAELEPYKDNIKAIFMKLDNELYLDCFIVEGVEK